MGKISSAVSHSVATESVQHSHVVVVKKNRNGMGVTGAPKCVA